MVVSIIQGVNKMKDIFKLSEQGKITGLTIYGSMIAIYGVISLSISLLYKLIKE